MGKDRMTSRIPFARRIVAGFLAVALAFGVPAIAWGDISSTDVIGDSSVGSDASLKTQAPDIVAPAGILQTMDGETLWARDANDERAMASTTKIMTAVVVLEHVDDLDETVTVPALAAGVGESSAGIQAGEKLTVRELLEAMLIHSANEAAETLAISVGGSVPGFVKLMNDKAAQLGLEHTHYTNPHGLDEAGHHTSATDLATLAEYAMRKPVFREVVGTEKMSISASWGTRTIETSNKLLGSFQGADGIKTGWTDDAGYCLVASAKRDGIELVAVVLGTANEDARFTQAARLLEWGFAHYRKMEIASAEETAALVPVGDYLDVSVPAVVSRDESAAVFDVRGELQSTAVVSKTVSAPVKAGQRLGTLSVTQGDRLVVQVPIVAASDVARPGLFERLGVWLTRAWRSVFGGAKTAPLVRIIQTS